MKYLFYILDGAADKQYKEYDGKTPLEVAKTPNLDQLCAQGQLKRWRSIPANLPAGTDVATATLFGATNLQNMGRAAIEAIADGIDIEGSIVYRNNFLHISSYTIKHYFPSKTVDFELSRLIDDLVHETMWKSWMIEQGLRWCVGQSGNLYLLADKEAPKSQVPIDLLGETYYEFWPKGWAKWCTQIALFLADHPINEERCYQELCTYDVLWPWGEGSMPEIPIFTQKGSCVSAVPIVKGLAHMAGLYVPDIVGATGDIETNIQAKTDAVQTLWSEYDFMLLHFDAPDVYSHEQDISKKIQAIELGDQLLGCVLNSHVEDLCIGVICDHYTFCETGQHGDQAVPYLFFDPDQKEISNKRFCERDADDAPVINGQEIWDDYMKSMKRRI